MVAVFRDYTMHAVVAYLWCVFCRCCAAAVHMENYRIYSTLQPRQVKWVTQDQAEWLITLDTGFIDEIPEYSYKDWDTGSNLMSSGSELG